MSIATIKRIAKCRKPQGECENCGRLILTGDAYTWYSVGFRSRIKHVRCTACVDASDSRRESNSKIASILGAQEEFNELISSCADVKEIAQALRDCGAGIREASEAWEESADNIEEGFERETEQSEEMRQKAADAADWADALDAEADDIEGEEFDVEEAPNMDEWLTLVQERAAECLDQNQMDY